MKRLLAGLTAIFVLALAAEAWGAPVKEVSLWIARDVAPGPMVRVAINTRNVPVVQMAAYKLPGTALLLRRDEEKPKQPPTGGKLVRRWSSTIATKAERPVRGQEDVYRSRQVNLPPLPPGVYLIIAQGGDKEVWAIVNITHLAVLVKRSPKRVLTWVCQAASGDSVKGAKVTLHERSGAAIASGMTRADGTCVFQAAPGSRQTVLVTHKQDVAAVPSGVTSGDGELKVHFQTDRPIYRPGQTVSFKAIVRRTAGRGHAPVRDTTCDVQVRDPKDNVLLEKKVKSNAIGTLSDQFELPSEGLTGAYTIVLNVEGDRAYHTFSVAAYRKPEFKVSVKPAQPRYLAGDEAVFEIEAAYYFGAPVPQAEVQYQIRRAAAPYGEYDETAAWYASNDGNLYPSDTYASTPFIAEGTLYTDNAGKLTIPIKTDRNAPDSTYQITCTVQDASRRQVQATGSVPVYAAELRLGIRTDVLVSPAGGVVPLQLTAVDLNGKPVAAQVTLTVKQPVWSEKEGRYKFKELTRTKVSILPTGKATAKIGLTAQGDLIITAGAPDRSGRKATANLSIWVAGPFAKVEKEEKQPTLLVKLNRASYAPGATVTAYVTTNVRSRPVLIAAEGRDIWSYEVVPAGSRAISWNLKTSLEMSPNVYVIAAQWTRSGMISGSALVPIPDLTRKLSVEITPERAAYRPGETASLRIHTTGENRQPVSAEVALSVVDEAIYALRPDTTPDPYAAFWGTRRNYVVTHYSAPQELSGGAYQRVSETASVRERFLDTAYWNAHVTTGADGAATVTFEIPGNLTTWRTTARAITIDTRGGSAVALFTVSRPVMLRLAVPRHMVKGDRLTLVGTVNNRTAEAHEFETAISAVGLRIEGETTKNVRVDGGGEGTVEWTIVADSLPESGEALVTGRTIAADAPADRGPEYSDALRVPVHISPPGIMQRIVIGGVLAREATADLNLPSDRIEPASIVSVSVYGGLQQIVDRLVRQVAASGRYSSPSAASQLLVAAIAGPGSDAKMVREDLALLSRNQLESGGWAWWDTDETADPAITAYVLVALSRAKSARLPVPDGLLQRGISGALDLYADTNLWEHRAILAAAVTLADSKKGRELLEEVHRRATSLSPYAELMLAEAFQKSGKSEWAKDALDKALQSVVTGPRIAYVPGGDHPGWSASTAEASAQALSALVRFGQDQGLQSRLAQWLVDPQENGWLSQEERAVAATALSDYLRAHPQPSQLGKVEILANGTKLEIPAEGDKAIEVNAPRSLLKDGSNIFTLRRAGEGEIFFSVEARVFRPALVEVDDGMRVLRRYEVQNAAGLWDQISGPVKPAAPVRCTVLVWPDDRPDAIRVVEPIPAGFEFIDSEYGGYAREDVRDDAVIHYLTASGEPVSFRYYLRAESEGAVTALPAAGEALRRPAVRGNTATTTVEVKE